MKLDLLAFGAHPDDVEIGVGGTLIKSVSQGYKVGVVDLTRGDKGTRGSAEVREEECKNASKIMGLAVRESLSIPDTMVSVTRTNILKVVEVIRKYRPEVVMLPPDDKRHPDHTNANRLVFEACYLSGLKNLEASGEKHRPFKILNPHKAYTFEPAKPTFVVDVTSAFRKKLAAIMAYKSQFPKGDKTRVGRARLGEIEEWVEGIARYYGMMIGTRYGEGFVTRETVCIDDVVALKVASM